MVAVGALLGPVPLLLDARRQERVDHQLEEEDGGRRVERDVPRHQAGGAVGQRAHEGGHREAGDRRTHVRHAHQQALDNQKHKTSLGRIVHRGLESFGVLGAAHSYKSTPERNCIEWIKNEALSSRCGILP